MSKKKLSAEQLEAGRKVREEIPKPLTASERKEVRNRIVDDLLSLRRAEQEKKEYLADWSDDWGPVKDRLNRGLHEVDTGERTEEEVCVMVPDFENETCDLYDAESGAFIMSRPLTLEELQKQIGDPHD